MKDSFQSFRGASPEEWRINIRGRLKSCAAAYLTAELGESVKLFFLESKRGWLYDSYSFMYDVDCDYIFFWIEDHICLVDPSELRFAVKEMLLFNVDQLFYSWFLDRYRLGFQIIEPSAIGRHLTAWNVDSSVAEKIAAFIQEDFYIIWATCVMSKNKFLSVLKSRKPYLKRWPRYLPFDFEKKPSDHIFSTLNCAFPKKELFAAIDDDHGQLGYSLISRGLYPCRIGRHELKIVEGLSRRAKILPKSPFVGSRMLHKAFFLVLSRPYGYFRRFLYSLGYFIR